MEQNSFFTGKISNYFTASGFGRVLVIRGRRGERVHELIEKTKATVFIVAQRINTILDADQIIVLDEGRIVGKGTHRELMAGCRVYQEIARSQLSDEELARYGAGPSASASEPSGERRRSDGRS